MEKNHIMSFDEFINESKNNLEISKKDFEEVSNLADYIKRTAEDLGDSVEEVESEPWVIPLKKALGKSDSEIEFIGMIELNPDVEYDSEDVWSEAQETGVGHAGSSSITKTMYNNKEVYIVNSGGDWDAVFA
jgi:hypothetical protein